MRNAPPTVPGTPIRPFHAAQVMFGAIRDRAPKVGRSVHPDRIAFDADLLLGSREVEHDPGKFAIADQQIGSASQKAKRHTGIRGATAQSPAATRGGGSPKGLWCRQCRVRCVRPATLRRSARFLDRAAHSGFWGRQSSFGCDLCTKQDGQFAERAIDVAGADGEDRIARTGFLQQIVDPLLQILAVDHVLVAGVADASG